MFTKIKQFLRNVWASSIWTDLTWLVVYFSWLYPIGARSLFEEPIMLPEKAASLPPLQIAVILAALVCLCKKAKAPLKALALGAMTFAVPFFNQVNNINTGGGFEYILYTLFFLSFLVSLTVAVWNATIYNWPFIVFATLAVSEAIVAEVTGWSGTGTRVTYLLAGHKSYFPSLIYLLIWISAILLAQVVALSIKHNSSLFRQIINCSARTKIIRKTILLWSVFPVIFGSLTLTHQRLLRSLEASYVIVLKESVEKMKSEATTDPDLNNLGLPGQLDGELQKFKADTNAKDASQIIIRAQTLVADSNLKVATNAITAAGYTTAEEARKGISAKVHKHTPDHAPGTSPRGGCRWYEFKCHFMTFIKGTVDGIYQSVRNDLLSEIDKKLESSANEAAVTSSAFITSAGNTIKDEMSKFSSQFNRALSVGFDAWNKFSTVMFLLSLIVLLKTFLMVLGRVAFHNSFGLRAPLCGNFLPGAKPLIPAKVIAPLPTGAVELQLPVGSGAYYVTSKVKAAEVTEALRVPRLFTAPFRRLKCGSYFANLVDMSRRRANAVLSVPPNQRLIEWQLGDNERILLDFNNLAAFSTNITFGKFVSFGMASLAFGRVLHYYAEGPGMIALQTEGPAEIGTPGADRSYHPECFVALELPSAFEFDSNQSLLGVLFSGFTVRRGQMDQVVIDTQAPSSRLRFTGIIKECWHWLLPI